MKLKELRACIASQTPVYVLGYRAVVVAVKQPRIVQVEWREHIAVRAYAFADAMIVARSKP